MALIICHECRGSVSTEAKVCPGCGAKVKIPKPEKKPYSKTSLRIWYGMLILLFVVGPIYRGIEYLMKSPEQLALEAKERQERDVQNAAQKAAQEKEVKLKFDREQASAMAAYLVKNRMRNPQSVTWKRISANDDSTVICLTFHAQNGFGGFNLEQIAVINAKMTESAKLWNKHCASTPLNDVTKSALRLLKVAEEK
ncbi:hypothetical protein [Methylotenera sp. 1P/1]|uniref:hypothetical protein n=1 Tax=Methylotenera sp. 1P/1 TaxID=1131551 RepID=UPI0012FBC57A|nr:hypothetical protein [Methylotenera sp. 1P/1]